MGRVRRYAMGYVLIAPALLAAVVFLFLPMVVSAYWSFTEFNGIRPPRWVGLDNYLDLFGNPRFLRSLQNTVFFVTFGMGIGPVLGLASALLLNRARFLQGLFRTAYFLPVMTSLTVVGTIWKMMLNEQGLLNSLLGFFALPGHRWLTDPTTALPSVVAASIWQGFGFETVVFLAALQSIPRGYYDAAKVDGAAAGALLRHITLPALRPTIVFVYVIGIIGSFQVFDQVFVMTNGGPVQATRTLVFHLYDRFNSQDLGQASAVAYVLLAILATLSYVQIRLSERGA